MGSLQDALLRAGLADESKSRKTKKRAGKGDKRGETRTRAAGQTKSTGVNAGSGPKPGVRAKSDLERAWQARRRAEKAEKERVKQQRLADQEARRKRNLELDQLVEGRILNDENAELPRYFEHLGRIRRVLCTAEQRVAINAGELGVVNLRGRYLIVAADTLQAYRAKAPDLVPDLSAKEPDEASDGEYPPVPDDLTW